MTSFVCVCVCGFVLLAGYSISVWKKSNMNIHKRVLFFVPQEKNKNYIGLEKHEGEQICSFLGELFEPE